jgi:hypothetical protein
MNGSMLEGIQLDFRFFFNASNVALFRKLPLQVSQSKEEVIPLP